LDQLALACNKHVIVLVNPMTAEEETLAAYQTAAESSVSAAIIQRAWNVASMTSRASTAGRRQFALSISQARGRPKNDSNMDGVRTKSGGRPPAPVPNLRTLKG
jgi:hypothetical protein